MAGCALRAVGLIAVIVITTWLTVPWGPFGRPATILSAATTNQEAPPVGEQVDLITAPEASPEKPFDTQTKLTGREARERLYHLMEVLFARTDIRDVGAAVEGLKDLAAMLPEHYIGPLWEGHPPGHTIIGRGRALSPIAHFLAKQDEKASWAGEEGEGIHTGRTGGDEEVRRLLQAEFDALDEAAQQRREMVEEIEYEVKKLRAKLAAKEGAGTGSEATPSADLEGGAVDNPEVGGQELGAKETPIFRVAAGTNEFVQVEEERSVPAQDKESGSVQRDRSIAREDSDHEAKTETGEDEVKPLPPFPQPRAPPSVPPSFQSSHGQSVSDSGNPVSEQPSSDQVLANGELSAGDTPPAAQAREEQVDQLLNSMGRYKTGVDAAFRTGSEPGAFDTALSPDSPSGEVSHAGSAEPLGLEGANPPGLEGSTSPLFPKDLRQALFENGPNSVTADAHLADVSAANEEWEENLETVAADANFLLGVLASTGVAAEHVPRNELDALEYYGRAAEAGAMQSQLALAHWYHQGYFVDPSCASALWYLRGVADSVMASAEEHGDMVLPRAPVRLRERERDASAAMNDLLDLDAPDQVAWDEDLALRGVAEAQRHVGYRRLLGRGVDQDVHEARRYFEAAAGAGDPYAAFNLGYMYMRGIAHPINYTAAHELFEYAAEDEMPAAYNGLGVLYYSGWGVPQNFTKAREYFELGAEYQDADSLYNLGSLYMGGFGVYEDMEKAYAYIQNASHAGHWKAPYTLGVMHAEGTGVERNCSQAVQFFTLFVSERGQWPDELEEAFLPYTDGDEWSALVRYLIMAEQGSHVACVNAAFILRKSKEYQNPDRYRLAYDLLERTRDSEANLRSGAMVDAGDLYYYGRINESLHTGPGNVPLVSSAQMALSLYEEAAASNDPEALYSMAWIYEHGELGKTRDHDKALDLLDEAMQHAFLEELFPLGLALVYFQFHDAYLGVLGFLSETKQGLISAGKGIADQGDTVLLLVLSTILFWAVARLRRRLNQVVNQAPAVVGSIEVSGEESRPEVVEVVQSTRVVTSTGANAGSVTPAGQSQSETRDGDPSASAQGGAGRAGDLRHRAASARSQG